MTRLLVLAVLFLGGWVRAEDPQPKPAPVPPVVKPPIIQVTSPTKFDSGELIVLKGTTSNTKWLKFVPTGKNADLVKPYQPNLQELFDVQPSPKAAGFTAPDGVYQFQVITGTADTPTTSLLEIVVGTPPPPGPTPVPPGPGPKPNPVPPPGPVGQVKRFVVVEDTTKAGQFRGNIMASPKLQAYYKSAGLSHLLISTQAQGPSGGPPPQEAKVWIDRAKSKGFQYYLATLDANNSLIAESEAPTDPDKFVEAIGGTQHQRAMGNIPPPEGKLKYRWTQFGDAPNVPLIPRSGWKEVDLSTFLPPVKDQDGIGACNAFASVEATEACRAQMGLDYVRLSPGYLYGNINGGSDNGSTLEDGLAWMTTHGTCTAATVSDLDWRHRPAGAAEESKNYIILEAYECPSFDAMASALQQGFFVIEGLMWYNNFTPDRDGWLPGSGRGGAGGHALCGYGLAQRNGVWGIRTRNSWGPGWGIGGNCVIPESLFGRSIGGYWAVRATVRTPSSFPMPKLAQGHPADRFRQDVQQAVGTMTAGAVAKARSWCSDDNKAFPVLKP